MAVVLFFCGLALKESIPVRLFPKNEISFLPHVWCFVQTLVFYLVLSAPFDLLGGLVLPWWFKEGYRSPLRFFLGWIRGVLLQTAMAIGFAIVLMEMGRYGGVWFGLAATGCLMALLIVLRRTMSSGLGGVRGVHSLGPRAPVAAFVWNFGGAFLVSRFSEVSFLSAAGIVTLGIYVSVWSFLGVLVVPLFLGERSSRVHQMILFPSWVCFGFLSRCLPAVVGLPEFWITGNDSGEGD